MADDRVQVPRASRWSAVVVGLWFVVVAVGPLVYAIVAQVMDPPLEPARTFMWWQALWSDGRYGVKYNFAVTWFATLVALFGPVWLVSMSIGAVRGARGQPVMPLGWRSLKWKHSDRGARLRVAGGVTGIAILFGAVCVIDASLLSPVGFLAQIALIVWPFTVIAGPVLFLDELLPTRVTVGPIEALVHTPATPSFGGTFSLQVGGRQMGLPEGLWRQLRPTDTIAVRRSGGVDRLRAVAVRDDDSLA